MAGSNKTIGGGGFHHLAIKVRDFDKSLKFYTDVMGFKEKMGWGEPSKRYMLLDTGDGAYFELIERPNEPVAREEGTLMHVAIRTSNIDAAFARVKAAGCEIVVEPKDVALQSTIGPTTIRVAFFKGPDGEIIEFFQHDKT